MLGSIISAATSLFDSAKARREQKNARDYNFGMWNAENAYNDPSAQMERLKNAGLNPNLVYGNGATTLAARSTPAQAIGDYGLGSAVEKGIQAMRAYQDVKQTDAQTQTLEAQKDLIKAQEKEADARTLSITRNSEISALGQSYDNMMKYLNTQILQASLPTILKELKVRKEGAETSLSDWGHLVQGMNTAVGLAGSFLHGVGSYRYGRGKEYY